MYHYGTTKWCRPLDFCLHSSSSIHARCNHLRISWWTRSFGHSSAWASPSAANYAAQWSAFCLSESSVDVRSFPTNADDNDYNCCHSYGRLPHSV
ncbi:unnamed protein product, partial [Protopolystoma xenopodis]